MTTSKMNTENSIWFEVVALNDRFQTVVWNEEGYRTSEKAISGAIAACKKGMLEAKIVRHDGTSDPDTGFDTEGDVIATVEAPTHFDLDDLKRWNLKIDDIIFTDEPVVFCSDMVAKIVLSESDLREIEEYHGAELKEIMVRRDEGVNE